ncbi:MAG: tripartite tricarboxylate transporter permease [Candidatus Rokuibacteriota bacterium]
MSPAELLAALARLADPVNVVAIGLAVLAGVLVGVIPGLGPFLAIVVLLPFTFHLPPNASLLALTGIFIGGSYGGAVTAILLGIPGTPLAAATLLDGRPLAERGEVGYALGLAVTASVFGGAFSVVMLAALSPLLAQLALKFGPFEYTLLGVLGLTTVASISPGSTLKGLLAATFGLLLATVGSDSPTTTPRYTFGIAALNAGTGLVPVLLGLFSIAQVLQLLERRAPPAARVSPGRLWPRWPRLPELRSLGPTYLKGSIIGTVIGALPGAGGVIAAFISYAEARRASPRPEEFGRGAPEGVVASEAANSAVVGGALIPTLTLGIPGDAITAVIMGALFIHGLTPGPNLYRLHADLLATVFVGMLVANLFMLFVGMYVVRLIVWAASVRESLVIPVVALISVLAAYATQTSLLDVAVMLVFGVVGFGMRKLAMPLPPIVLGLVLGEMIELSLRRALTIADGNLMTLFGRPYAIGILALIALLLCWPLLGRKRALAAPSE